MKKGVGENHLLEVLQRERIATVTRYYAPGETILEEGSRRGSLFIVTLGIVALSATYAGGKESTRKDATLRLLQQGQTFGYPFVKAGSFSQAQALTDCAVVSVNIESLQYLLRRNPEVTLGMVTMRESDLLYQEELAGRLMDRKTEVRLANLLLELATRFGEISGEGEQRIRLRLTHEELARMVAATREGVTNALNRWKRTGVLQMREQRIVIQDVEVLEAAACQIPGETNYMYSIYEIGGKRA